MELHSIVSNDSTMEKAAKLLSHLQEYYALAIVTCGYWIEMAEDMEVNDNIEKVGKHLLVAAKLFFFK